MRRAASPARLSLISTISTALRPALRPASAALRTLLQPTDRGDHDAHA
jgi:hypothetical protein